jgi:hypothetical protein
MKPNNPINIDRSNLPSGASRKNDFLESAKSINSMATLGSSDSSRASVSKTEFSPNYNPNSIGALDPEEQKEIADYNPNAPLELEAQYQLAQDEEKPLPPPVSERGIPRTVTMLLATGAAVLFAVGVWNVVKPREGVKQIAQRTPKETKEPLIQDEKPELLAKLAYLDQQKLLAEKRQKTAKPKLEPSPKPSRAPRTVLSPRTPRLVATRSAAPPPTPLREPLPAPRTVVRTVTVPAPIPQRTPSRTPAPPPAPIPKPLVPPPLIPTPTSEKIDPFERWNQLAQLGQIRGNFDPNRIANAVSATPSTPATTSATAAALTKPAPTTEFLTVNIGNQKSQPSDFSFEQIPEKLYSHPNNASGERLHPEFPYGGDSLETTDNSQNPTNQLTPNALSPQISSDSTDNPIETATRLSESQTSLPDTEFQTFSPEAVPEASALTNSPTLEQVNSPGAKGILNRTPQTDSTSQTAIVPLGTTANGIVSVPLLWDEGSGKQQGDKFAVTLTDNVTATNGFIAFPAGTVVIAKASTVSLTNRMVQATAVALVYSDRNGQIKQQPIPEGAILIAGEGGRPLIASGYFDPGNDIAGQDILTAVLSGVARVGQVFAEPKVRSSSSISGGFGNSTTTVESRDPQIWSAVLDGFFSPLAKRMESRSDRATEELLNRPNVAVVNKGTPVSITVNSFLNIHR